MIPRYRYRTYYIKILVGRYSTIPVPTLPTESCKVKSVRLKRFFYSFRNGYLPIQGMLKVGTGSFLRISYSIIFLVLKGVSVIVLYWFQAIY